MRDRHRCDIRSSGSERKCELDTVRNHGASEEEREREGGGREVGAELPWESRDPPLAHIVTPLSPVSLSSNSVCGAEVVDSCKLLVWALRTELGSSVKAAYTWNCRASSPALIVVVVAFLPGSAQQLPGNSQVDLTCYKRGCAPLLRLSALSLSSLSL